MFNYKCNITPQDTNGKVIFWDIDGTLAPYRFDGGVSDVPFFFESYCPFVEDHYLRYRHPSRFMQKLLPTCDAKEHVICGHYRHQTEIDDKEIWTDTNFPYIKRRLFVYMDDSKADAIIKFCSENDIDLEDVIFVDDVTSILKDAEGKGIESCHISSFMDWFM